MRTVFKHAFCAVASLGLTTGIVAFADPAVASVGEFAPRQAFVRTSDLDLQSPAGRATATRRIRAAASQVCALDGFHLGTDHACRAKAISDAEQALAGTALAAR